MNKVSVIIVNYNTAKEIGRCLISIQNSKWRQNFSPSECKIQNLEIIVVDNASTDDSIEVIRQLAEKFKNIKLIENKKNLGFAKACNQGAKNASGKFLFFLNPDIVVKKDTLVNLLEFAKKNPNSIIGPRLLNPDGSLQGSCYNLPTLTGAIKEFLLGQKWSYEKFAPTGDKPTKVQAIVGAALFCPRKIFERLKGFDERYFLYYEDLDFCRRARKIGYKIYYLPEAKIVHSLGISGEGIKEKTYEWLKKSSKIYHGTFLSFLINQIIFWGQRWQKFFKKKN
jgi:GT2 family glycosyltransferase